MRKSIILFILLAIALKPSIAQFDDNILSKPGHFVLGCNYWASNAGANMWVDWKPEVVEQDFKRLSEAGIEVLRVFPNWRDFQPLTAVRAANSTTLAYRFGELPLPDNRFGAAGISEEMVKRMKFMLDLGEKYKFKFIVSLVTGHMSGRVYIPAAFDGQDPIADPLVIKWEIKFVKCLVNELKAHKNIVGWGLGNETNCMAADNVTSDQTYVWTANIANAIRSCDNTRPVLSDMHSLKPEGGWSILDQADLTDLLTTHPYPLFTPYCSFEPVNTIRPMMHGTAESRMYTDIGNKPTIVGETGTLGPMLSNDNIAADFFRTTVFSIWANDCHGSLWWCNSDFPKLKYMPYDNLAFETELGLFKTDGSPKPIVSEMKKFTDFYKAFSYQNLPKVKTDAVCILSNDQNHWANAFSTYILGKQAGLNVEFQYYTQKLKESQLYILPGLSSPSPFLNYRMEELLSKISEGATLYMSLDNAWFGNFEAMTGLRVTVRERRSNTINFSMDSSNYSIPASIHYQLENIGAKIIASEADKNPVFSVYTYGKGKIYLLTAPLEDFVSKTAGSFASTASQYWKIYREIGKDVISKHIISKNEPLLAITEHEVSKDKNIAIVINMSPNSLNDKLVIKQGWKIGKVHYGKAETAGNTIAVELPKNDALVIELIKQ